MSQQNEKWSSQNKLGEAEELPLLLLKETKMPRRLLSMTTLFTSVYNNESLIQKGHGSFIISACMWSASFLGCSFASTLQVIPDNMLSHHIFRVNKT